MGGTPMPRGAWQESPQIKIPFRKNLRNLCKSVDKKDDADTAPTQ
jgi:hypothetical protein